MNSNILYVGIGGLLGSITRYLISLYFNKILPSAFPYGTFIVNISGCFLIGLVYGLSFKFANLSPAWRLFLATGFCGGYTTFSAFSYENMNLLQSANYTSFIAYTLLSIITGILATFFGVLLVKIF
jgi:CrcB protein